MKRIRFCLLSYIILTILRATTVLAADLVVPPDPPLNGPDPIVFESEEGIVFDRVIINSGADVTADADESILLDSVVVNSAAVLNTKAAFEVMVHNAISIQSGARFTVTIKDQDGLPNHWEVDHCGTFNYGPGDDPDFDGLTMLYEFQSGYHPCDPDSDNDGMPDGWEDIYGLNVLGNDAAADPDQDGLSNLDEFLNDTDPTNPDTDGDGMPDGYEVINGLDPLVNDAGDDLDGDGFNNKMEYDWGTYANDANSRPIEVEHNYDNNGNLTTTIIPPS